MRSTVTFLSLFLLISCLAQVNMQMTNGNAAKVMRGMFNPDDYQASNLESDHHEIICGLQHRISTDSLKAYLIKLESFHSRHTYSDTMSADSGIGAARRWAFRKFEEISTKNENRLLPSYLQFDYPNGACGSGYGWRNVLAVLPGTDTANHKLIIIQAHMDSRCADPCDAECFAPGTEDNGSGSALVIELARVMSRYSFEHSIVFMLTIGEEEGLYGAEAMAAYCADEGIKIKAVLNNDIVGGIICGKTSSPPGCPEEGHLDSTHVRLFSSGSISLPHRSFARTIKLYNDEKLKPLMLIPMEVEVMNQEDRTGRGGDHIPFRVEGFTNVRFTSANEHGDAAPHAGYTDRQHTSGDVLGIDTTSDGILDEYFVNFEYLKRNAVINGTSLTLLALGPEMPEFILQDEASGLRVELTSEQNYPSWRIGIRNSVQSQQFDAIYRSNDKSFVIPGLTAGETYFVSVAAVDGQGITSPFTGEQFKQNDANTEEGTQDNLPYSIDCSLVGIRPVPGDPNISLAIYPNPGRGEIFLQSETVDPAEISIEIISLNGSVVYSGQFESTMNKWMLKTQLEAGFYFYRLHLEDDSISSGKLVILPD